LNLKVGRYTDEELCPDSFEGLCNSCPDGFTQPRGGNPRSVGRNAIGKSEVNDGPAQCLLQPATTSVPMAVFMGNNAAR
jgi:hypothetical protein